MFGPPNGSSSGEGRSPALTPCEPDRQRVPVGWGPGGCARIYALLCSCDFFNASDFPRWPSFYFKNFSCEVLLIPQLILADELDTFIGSLEANLSHHHGKVPLGGPGHPHPPSLTVLRRFFQS
jgi:hypothetical protein